MHWVPSMKVIVDLQSLARDHIPFNTAFLQIARRVFGDEDILFVAREDHVAEYRALLDDQRIAFLPLPPDLHTPPRGRLVTHDERAHYRFVEQLCVDRSADHLIMLGVRCDMLERLRRQPPAPRVDALLHATIAEPTLWRSRNPFLRRFDMFGVLRRRFPTNVRLIFLEDGIEQKARAMLAPGTRTMVLPHPIPGAAVDNLRAIDPAAIHVGFLGGNYGGKGFDHFLKLARDRPAHLRLHCVGPRGAGYDTDWDGLFDTPPSPHKLDQAAFDRLAARNDVNFLPLDPAWYDLVASGTLLDCIRFGVPPVIVRNAVIDAIEARYGRFGFVVDRPEDGIALLRDMPYANLAEQVDALRRTLHRIAEDRTVEAVSRQCGPALAAQP